MKHIIKQGQAFEKEELDLDKAFSQIDGMGEPYKKEYAQELANKHGLESLTL